MVMKLTNSLGVSSDFLPNKTSDDLTQNSLTDKELLNQFKAIENYPGSLILLISLIPKIITCPGTSGVQIFKMPEQDKDVVKTLIEAFITKGKLKQLVL
jgi:hypothetical protein